MNKIGRIVVIGIVLTMFGVGVTFYTLLKNSPEAIEHVEQRIESGFLETTYSGNKNWVVEGTKIPNNPWSFSIDGDRLIVQAPAIETASDRNKVRSKIEEAIIAYLGRTPNRSKKAVLVEVHFQND